MIVIEELRDRFYAETDIELKHTLDWKPYAEWLELLSADRLNKEMIAQNKKFQDAFCEVITLLDHALSRRVDIDD